MKPLQISKTLDFLTNQKMVLQNKICTQYTPDYA